MNSYIHFQFTPDTLSVVGLKLSMHKLQARALQLVDVIGTHTTLYMCLDSASSEALDCIQGNLLQINCIARELIHLATMCVS